MCATITTAIDEKARIELEMKLNKIMPVPTVVRGNDMPTLRRSHKSRI